MARCAFDIIADHKLELFNSCHLQLALCRAQYRCGSDMTYDGNLTRWFVLGGLWTFVAFHGTLGLVGDQFSDQGIVLLPVFARCIQSQLVAPAIIFRLPGPALGYRQGCILCSLASRLSLRHIHGLAVSDASSGSSYRTVAWLNDEEGCNLHLQRFSGVTSATLSPSLTDSYHDYLTVAELMNEVDLQHLTCLPFGCWSLVCHPCGHTTPFFASGSCPDARHSVSPYLCYWLVSTRWSQRHEPRTSQAGVLQVV